MMPSCPKRANSHPTWAQITFLISSYSLSVAVTHLVCFLLISPLLRLVLSTSSIHTPLLTSSLKLPSRVFYANYPIIKYHGRRPRGLFPTSILSDMSTAFQMTPPSWGEKKSQYSILDLSSILLSEITSLIQQAFRAPTMCQAPFEGTPR